MLRMNHFIVMALATSAISLTVTKSKLFKTMRQFIKFMAEPNVYGHGWFELLSELLSCHYCFSHWVAFLMVWTCRTEDVNITTWFITSMAVVGAAAVNSGIVLWLGHNEAKE